MNATGAGWLSNQHACFSVSLSHHPDHNARDTLLLLSMKARKLLPNYGGSTSLPDHDRASLRTKVGPLLEEASHHLTRVLARLTLDQEHAGVSHFMDDITSMQTYLIDSEQAAREMRDKAMQLFRKHLQSRVDETEAGGQPSPSGTSGTITFTLSPEAIAEDLARPFPPSPSRIPVR